MKIVITGGLGFIGSSLVEYLNKFGISPIIYDYPSGDKWKNVAGLDFDFYDLNINPINDRDWGEYILVHLGANSSTSADFDSKLIENNVNYSLRLFSYNWKKIIYASSASVYGETTDFRERIHGLVPLNAYGFSKWLLDKKVADRNYRLSQRMDGMGGIYGLRFFNVWGRKESHKGNMKSVIYQAINKEAPLFDIKLHENLFCCWKLFKSEREDIKDGQQARDFVYVEDVCKVIYHFILYEFPSFGVYNVGSGHATSFFDIVTTVDPNLPIEYIPIPEKIKRHYQYYTCADLEKLRSVGGYKQDFQKVEEVIKKLK